MPRVLAGLLTFVAGCVFYSCGAYYGGKFEARLDVMSGAYSIRVYGTQDGGIAEYKEALSNELGIDMVAVAGCVVSRELQEKTLGYNEAMEAAIERRYGQGILERFWRRARSEYQKKAVISFNQTTYSLVSAKTRSTKSHETARIRPVFREASCEFLDRALTIETKNFKLTHYQKGIDLASACSWRNT